jgi:molecular chaperone GrpE
MSDRTDGSPKVDGSPPGDHGRHRPRTRADERIAALDTSAAGLAAQLDELREQLSRVEQEAAENKAAWQRSAADFANYRRRTEQERAELLGLASDSLLLKVLTLADDFDRAIEHIPSGDARSPWVEGIVAIDRKLRQLLESEGVTPLEAQGRPFDPREHQAISHEETDEAADGTVLRELQRGYRVRDRVLRPALVAVARNEDQTRPVKDTSQSEAPPGADRE